MDDEELYSHIGNVVRLAALVRPSEVGEICANVDQLPTGEMLLQPRLPALSEADRRANEELLRAFQSFNERVCDVASAHVLFVEEISDGDCEQQHES